jgi:hypothetical protein
MVYRVKLAFGLLSILVGFVVAYNCGKQSFDSVKFVEVSELLKRSNRGLAAVKKEGLNVSLTHHLPISTDPRQTLSHATLVKTANQIQLTLGNFSTLDRNNPVFACQVYDKVIMVYQSAPQSDETPGKKLQTMAIETDCLTSENDIKHLKPLTLNSDKILSLPSGEGSYTFNDGAEFVINLIDVDQDEPLARKWILSKVQFQSSGNRRPLMEVSTSELSEKNRPRLNIQF